MCALLSGPRARSFRVAGKTVVCPHCENVLFHDRKASLKTSASELFNVAWLDRQARVLICANCSRLGWFHDSDEVMAVDS
jgi:uncharacterized protein with PIN domain